MTVQNVPQKTECFPQAHHKTIRSLTKYCKKNLRIILVCSNELLVLTNYFGKGDIDQRKEIKTKLRNYSSNIHLCYSAQYNIQCFSLRLSGFCTPCFPKQRFRFSYKQIYVDTWSDLEFPIHSFLLLLFLVMPSYYSFHTNYTNHCDNMK